MHVRVRSLASGDVVLEKILPKTMSIAELLDIVSPRGKGILMFRNTKLDEFLLLDRVLEDMGLRRGQTRNLELVKAAGSQLRRHAHIVEP